MKATALLRLYPARWRARYGDEMSALLEGERPGRVAFDLVKGAVSAHLSSYPPAEEVTMTRPRFQLAASLLAALAVLPAAVFFAATIARGLQPTQHQPARAADQIVHAFEGLPIEASILLMLVGPAIALALGGIVLATRVRADDRLREDLAAFGAVTLRLVRRPAFVLSLLAAVASVLILFFLLVHSIVG